MRTITYAIDTETKLTVSRVGTELAYFVLDYDNMLPENNFSARYHLDKMDVFHWHNWSVLKWTRKIPKDIKNLHRKYWGFSKLK